MQAAREKLVNQVPLMKLGAAAGRLGDHATQLFNATITAYLKQIDKNRAHKAGEPVFWAVFWLV